MQCMCLVFLIDRILKKKPNIIFSWILDKISNLYEIWKLYWIIWITSKQFEKIRGICSTGPVWRSNIQFDSVLDVNLPSDPTCNSIRNLWIKKSVKELEIGEEGVKDSTVQTDPDSSSLRG
jgi:hypothetical protein